MNDYQRMSQALLGCALGDSWGYPFEFFSPYHGSQASLLRAIEDDLPDNNPLSSFSRETVSFLVDPRKKFHDMYIAIISDDTQMTLASLKVCYDILRKGIDIPDPSQDEDAFIDEFVNYSYDDDNNREPGVSVTTSLYNQALRKFFNEGTAPINSNGCGSVMRFSPTAILMPENQSIEWTIRQALTTHDSSSSIITAILLGALVRNHRIKNITSCDSQSLIDICIDICRGRGDHYLDSYTQSIDVMEHAQSALCAPSEKYNDVRDITQLLVMAKAFSEEIVRKITEGYITTVMDDPKYADFLGEGWDSVTCTVVSVMLADVFRQLVSNGFNKTLATYIVLNCATGWRGDRDSRGAVLGALIGSLYPEDVQLQSIIDKFSLVFEPRYHKPIMNCYWNGFDKLTKEKFIEKTEHSSNLWMGHSVGEEDSPAIVLTEDFQFEDD